MNVYTCIASFFSSFYLQVVKSRGHSPQCGSLSVMGWEGGGGTVIGPPSGATCCCGDPAKNLVKLSKQMNKLYLIKLQK